MILKSQNQGGALWFLAVLWYYLKESTEKNDFFFRYLPPFYPEKTFVHAFLGIFAKLRHHTKKIFFLLNLLVQYFNNM